MSSLTQPFPDLDRILPHRGPSRLVHTAVEADRERALCRARVPSDNAFCHAGRVPAFVAIEMAAQAAAVHAGLVRVEDGEIASPRVGYLTGVREAQCPERSFPADTDLDVIVEITHFAVPISLHRFEVRHDGRSIATGSISTYVP